MKGRHDLDILNPDNCLFPGSVLTRHPSRPRFVRCFCLASATSKPFVTVMVIWSVSLRVRKLSSQIWSQLSSGSFPHQSTCTCSRRHQSSRCTSRSHTISKRPTKLDDTHHTSRHRQHTLSLCPSAIHSSIHYTNFRGFPSLPFRYLFARSFRTWSSQTTFIWASTCLTFSHSSFHFIHPQPLRILDHPIHSI